MIIKEINTKNLLRFSELSIRPPASGRIAISGPNESGKSAILEAICLALFGRTYNLPPERLHKAVRWGADQAELRLVFQGGDGATYAIERFLSSDGEHRAVISRENQPLAQGVEAVAQAVARVAGFDYRHYVDAFYLAQREGLTARAQGDTIKMLAGVNHLEAVAIRLAEENDQDAQAVKALEKDVEGLHARHRELNLRPEVLGQLQESAKRADTAAANAKKESALWNAFAADYERSGRTVEEAGARFLGHSLDSTVAAWKEDMSGLGAALKNLDKVGERLNDDEESPSAPLKGWLHDLEGRFKGLHDLLTRVAEERRALGLWLGEHGEGEDTPGDNAVTESKRLDAAVKKASGGRKWSMRLGLFLLLAAVLLGGAFGVLQYPDLIKQLASAQGFPVDQWLDPGREFLLAQLATNVPQWTPEQAIWLAGGGGLALLLSFFLFYRFFKAAPRLQAALNAQGNFTARVERARKRASVMDRLPKEGVAAQVEIFRSLDDAALEEELNTWTNGDGFFLVREEGLLSFRRELESLLERFHGEMEELVEEAVRKEEEASQQADKNIAEGRRLAERIAREEERLREDEELKAALGEQGRQLSQLHERIRERGIARKLALGTCRRLTAHFNSELPRVMSRLAPLFTGGRYGRIRIDEKLSVQAFSNQKNDFLDMEELSAGARHQLMLAVRVALAEALAGRAGQTGQFMALDEPFAFYDRERFGLALAALPRIAPALSQFFIVSQEFVSDEPTEARIDCSRDAEELRFG